MNIGLSSRLYLIIVIYVIAIGAGYWHSYSLRTKVTEIWKQTLQEDCVSRMREINAKKTHGFASATSSDIKIVTEGQTLHLKKDGTKSLAAEEKDFLSDQLYLSLKNPVKIEKLDSLFQLKLKENGFNFKTAVSLYNNETDKKTFYGQEDVKVLHDYLKLTYKVDIRDVILLEGYVKGSWLENLLWGYSYYIVLSIMVCFALGMLMLKKRNSKYFKQCVYGNEQPREIEQEQLLPVEQELAPFTESSKESPKQPLQPTDNVIWYDEKQYALIYGDQMIQIAPKLFGLFYQLAQGENYFQSYTYLYQALGEGKEETDKKILEQLVFRLRKELEKPIPDLSIDTIRASGYQIKGKNNVEIRIDRIENKNQTRL